MMSEQTVFGLLQSRDTVVSSGLTKKTLILPGSCCVGMVHVTWAYTYGRCVLHLIGTTFTNVVLNVEIPVMVVDLAVDEPSS